MLFKTLGGSQTGSNSAVVSCSSLKRYAGLPWWSSRYGSACLCRAHGFDLWSRKIPHTMEQLSPCVTTPQPMSLLSLCAATTEAQVPRA